jgi:hypothetical protein
MRSNLNTHFSIISQHDWIELKTNTELQNYKDDLYYLPDELFSELCDTCRNIVPFLQYGYTQCIHWLHQGYKTGQHADFFGDMVTYDLLSVHDTYIVHAWASTVDFIFRNIWMSPINIAHLQYAESRLYTTGRPIVTGQYVPYAFPDSAGEDNETEDQGIARILAYEQQMLGVVNDMSLPEIVGIVNESNATVFRTLFDRHIVRHRNSPALAAIPQDAERITTKVNEYMSFIRSLPHVEPTLESGSVVAMKSPAASMFYAIHTRESIVDFQRMIAPLTEIDPFLQQIYADLLAILYFNRGDFLYPEIYLNDVFDMMNSPYWQLWIKITAIFSNKRVRGVQIDMVN